MEMRENMDHDLEFTSTVIYDLPLYREFQRGALAAMTYRTVTQWVLVGCLACLIWMMVDTGSTFAFLFLAVCLLLAAGIRWICGQGGDVQYKRILSNSGGQPPRTVVAISGGGIRMENTYNGNINHFEFHRVRKIVETQNLLILMMEYQQGVVIDKRTLTGGSVEELKRDLLTVCTGVKKKKIRTGKNARIRGILFGILFAAGLLLCLFQWVSGGRLFMRYGGNTVGKLNGLTYEEIGEKLETLGIGGIGDETVDGLQKAWDALPEEYRQYSDKTIDLLTALGYGTYDPETWAWSPSSSDVYAFDMEVLNVDSMYTDFLRGVAALGDGELDFADLEENLDRVNWEQGTGKRSVSFTWNGESFCLNAEMMNDWFDVRVLDDLNGILAPRCGGKQLYFASDGGQMILVFYRDQAWADSFEDVTGIPLGIRIG